MSEFNPKDELKLSTSKLTAKLGQFDFEQLQTLEKAERNEKEPRVGVLKSLQAEISARQQANPGLALSPVSIARIASIVHGIANDTPFDELADDDRAAAVEAVDKVRSGEFEGDSEETRAFANMVKGLVPLLLEMEQMEGQRVREVIADGDMASDSERKAETLVKDIAKLAFCDAAGDVLFKLTPGPGEISLRGSKAIFNREVELVREKRRVALSQVVALDEQGRRLARVRWATPLIGGGGKLARVPRGYIAFSL